MKEKNTFLKKYLLYVLLLAIACTCAVIYVNNTLIEYEDSQSEILVKEQVENIKNAIKTNNIETIIPLYEVNQAKYDKEIVEFDEYKEKLTNAKEISYRLKTGTYSENGQFYEILADSDPIAILELESINEETKLAILKLMDWKVKSINPLITLKNYEYTIDVPINSKILINGYEVTDFTPSNDENWQTCKLEKLYSEPTIEIYDSYGCLTEYYITNNHVTPILHTYNLTLPNTFEVYINTTKIEGNTNELETQYNILTANENLILKDSYGNNMLYTSKENIYAYDYELTIPSNYTIATKELKIEDYLINEKDNPKYQYCKEYTDMPTLKTYHIEDTLSELNFEIYDNLGNLVNYQINNGIINITEQVGTDEIFKEFKDQIDVMDIAKKWSYFMTDDLSGNTNGFETIKKYLIKDSYMYNVAYKWATGIDITLTSAHRTSDNYFKDEKVTNFIKYNDKLFSCDVSFVKYMYLYKSNKWVDDPMNSTFYFLNIGEIDKPNWVILDIQEIITK